MPVDQSTQTQISTCVMLAPADVSVGKNVTDALRAGGWTLLRTDNAIEAMAALCRLEQARQVDHGAADARHMLIAHRDVDADEIAGLMHAVRKHLPSVKVHEITTPAPGSAADVSVNDAVVGRIGRSDPHAPKANVAPRRTVHSNEHNGEEAKPEKDARLPHEVTRDEIAMLLSDDAEARRKRTTAEDGR